MTGSLVTGSSTGKEETALAGTKAEMYDTEKELELTAEEQGEWNKLEPLKQNELMKAAMRLHRNTGHRPPRVMVRILRKRGATAATIAAVDTNPRTRRRPDSQRGRPK